MPCSAHSGAGVSSEVRRHSRITVVSSARIVKAHCGRLPGCSAYCTAGPPARPHVHVEDDAAASPADAPVHQCHQPEGEECAVGHPALQLWPAGEVRDQLGDVVRNTGRGWFLHPARLDFGRDDGSVSLSDCTPSADPLCRWMGRWCRGAREGSKARRRRPRRRGEVRRSGHGRIRCRSRRSEMQGDPRHEARLLRSCSSRSVMCVRWQHFPLQARRSSGGAILLLRSSHLHSRPPPSPSAPLPLVDPDALAFPPNVLSTLYTSSHRTRSSQPAIMVKLPSLERYVAIGAFSDGERQ